MVKGGGGVKGLPILQVKRTLKKVQRVQKGYAIARPVPWGAHT